MKNNALGLNDSKTSVRKNIFRTEVLPRLLCLFVAVVLWLAITNVTKLSADNDTAAEETV